MARDSYSFMDRRIRETIARHAVARRVEPLLNAVFGYFIDDLSENDLIARLKAIYRDEREKLIAEDALLHVDLPTVPMPEQSEKEV